MSEMESHQRREAEEALRHLLSWQAAGHPSEGSLDALEAIARLRPFLERAELDAVRRARQDMVSWAEIATRLGVSRQSAWEKWRDIEPEPGRTRRPKRTRRRLVKVPSLRGLTFPQAALRLEREGLVAVDDHGHPRSADAPPPGRVAGHAPETGARVDPDTHVLLFMRDDGGAGEPAGHDPEPMPGLSRALAEPLPEEELELAASEATPGGA